MEHKTNGIRFCDKKPDNFKLSTKQNDEIWHQIQTRPEPQKKRMQTDNIRTIVFYFRY